MNYRLLKPEEKRANYLGRLQRNKLARRKRRRAQAIVQSDNPFESILLATAGQLSEDEYADYHEGHLTRVKSLLRRKTKRSAFSFVFEDPQLPIVAEEDKLQVAQPTRKLQKSRRGRLPGWFSAPPLPVPNGPVPGFIILAVLLNNRFLRSYCRFRVLEYAEGLFRMSLPMAVDSAGRRLDGGRFRKREVVTYKWMRRFQDRFDTGRRAYAGIVVEDGLAVARGDWAFFDHGELLDLLPGLRLPQRLHRQEYFVNRHATEDDNTACLDLHTADYTPLIRCDLRPPPVRKPRWRPTPREFHDILPRWEYGRREVEALMQGDSSRPGSSGDLQMIHRVAELYGAQIERSEKDCGCSPRRDRVGGQ